MNFDLPEESHQDYCEHLAKNILGNDWIFVKIESFVLKEDTKKNLSNISYKISLDPGGKLHPVKGCGQGIIDALFSSILQKLSNQFISLNKLEFNDFTIQVSFLDAKRRLRTDAPVEVCLIISTSRFVQTFFRHKSVSLVSATIEVVRKSIEYFINLERACVLLRENIEDAKRRNRQDLINENSFKMFEIIKIIPLEDVLKKENF